MAYKFPLATVLRVKQSIEKKEELALQKILLEMSQVQHQIQTLTKDIATARQTLEEAMKQVLPAVHIESEINRIDVAIQRKKDLVNSLAELSQKREMQTRQYQTAHINRKVLSDLQDRQHSAYEQERIRAEQKFIDEIFAFRARRGELP